MAMDGLKKVIVAGSLTLVSALGPVNVNKEPGQSDRVEAIQKFQEIFSSRIINKTGEPMFVKLFQDQLKVMMGTKVGAAVLRDLPKSVNYILAPKPNFVEEAAFWDGKNCTIYDDTLLSGNGGAAMLIAHETRHAIQGHKYDSTYLHMPTEQQIAYFKMTEIETRLQDVIMKEELYNKGAPGSHSYEFASADWMDYHRLKANIARSNPNISAVQVERVAKTRFVVDSWEGNHQKEEYEQKDNVRTFKDWIRTYNENSLRLANKRCAALRPRPDTTVDESLVVHHHDIMQEFIGRMGIDVPADFFDNLKHDKSLRVIRRSKELAAIGKNMGQDLKMVVIPRDDFVRVGGIVVNKDNSTMMFSPEKRKEFEKEIRGIVLANRANQAER